MGESKETEQIGFGSDAGILLLINIMAEIRPLLIDERLDFQKGLVLFCADNAIGSRTESFFQKIGAAQCKSIGKSEWNIPNNRIGIHNYNRYDEERKVFEFLQNEMFTPVIVICGILPEFMKRGMNLIVLEQGIYTQGPLMLRTFKDFCDFIRNNPQLLQRQIRLCRSAEFHEQTCKGSLYISLEVAAEVFCIYYRENHDEIQSREMRISLHQAINRGVELAECYAEDLESTDFIKKAVENYIDANAGIQIGKVGEIDGELTKAVQWEEAVLYDDKFYYMPEKILRKACESFRDSVSILSVKKALLDSGFLCCNDAKDGNYTVKKLLTNAYGYSFRPRFLKIRKEFFMSGSSLGLEERGRKCTLAISMENHAG